MFFLTSVDKMIRKMYYATLLCNRINTTLTSFVQNFLQIRRLYSLINTVKYCKDELFSTLVFKIFSNRRKAHVGLARNFQKQKIMESFSIEFTIWQGLQYLFFHCFNFRWKVVLKSHDPRSIVGARLTDPAFKFLLLDILRVRSWPLQTPGGLKVEL